MNDTRERQHNLIPQDHPQLSLILLLETALRVSWSADVCNELDKEQWTSENPAFGQCVISTLVLLDWLTQGTIVKDDDHDHFWLQDEYGEIDLTREQFPIDTILQATRERTREELVTGERAKQARTQERYETLRDRVKSFMEHTLTQQAA